MTTTTAIALHAIATAKGTVRWRTNSRGDYWVLDRRTGRLEKLGGKVPEASLLYAQFNPDATRVAYVRQNDIYVEDLESRAITRDRSGSPCHASPALSRPIRRLAPPARTRRGKRSARGPGSDVTASRYRPYPIRPALLHSSGFQASSRARADGPRRSRIRPRSSGG